jgi:hypothetical protein
MKRRHKVTAGVSAASLLALGTGLLEAWSAHERADRAALNHEANQCEVAVCEARGGRWWHTGCWFGPLTDTREPK